MVAVRECRASCSSMGEMSCFGGQGQARPRPMHGPAHSTGRAHAPEFLPVPLYTSMARSEPCSWPQPDRNAGAFTGGETSPGSSLWICSGLRTPLYIPTAYPPRTQQQLGVARTGVLPRRKASNQRCQIRVAGPLGGILPGARHEIPMWQTTSSGGDPRHSQENPRHTTSCPEPNPGYTVALSMVFALHVPAAYPLRTHVRQSMETTPDGIRALFPFRGWRSGFGSC